MYCRPICNLLLYPNIARRKGILSLDYMHNDGRARPRVVYTASGRLEDGNIQASSRGTDRDAGRITVHTQRVRVLGPVRASAILRRS